MPDLKPVGQLKPIGTITDNNVKPVGKLKPIGEVPLDRIKDFGAPSTEENNTTDDIINRIPDLEDSQKQIIKELAMKGVKGEELSNSILTLQGKHATQTYVNDFGTVSTTKKHYYDDKGIPHPLGINDRPPENYNMASVWGNKVDANDDGALTTVAKHLFNFLPNMVENAADMIHLPYVAAQQLGTEIGRKEFMTGLPVLPDKYKNEDEIIHEADWYKGVKAASKQYQMITSDKSNEGFIQTENIKKFSDLLDSKNFHFTADNIAGTVGQIAKSVLEFTSGGKLAKGVGIGSATKMGTATNLFVGSYMTQLGDVLEESKRAGLTTEDAYKLATAITFPLAAIDLTMGVEGKIFRDQAAATQRKSLIKAITEGFVRDNAGKITRESLDEAFNVTLTAGSSMAKTWLKETGKTSLGEAAQESLQKFTQNAGEQLYDHLSDKEKAKFGTDAFSPKAFADYIQEGIAGAFGGAPTALAYNRIRAINKSNEQSNSAFGLVQQGDEAINSFKKNILLQLKEGKLTQEEADNAIIKVDSYNSYNRLITNKGLNIGNQNKRELFDKTFQQENLETRMKNMGDISKLSPIERAEYHGYEKQSHDIQKDINNIILKSQVQEETTVGEKTITDIGKSEEKPGKEEKKPILSEQLKALRDKYSESGKPKEETRSYSEIPVGEFNHQRMNARTIHAKTVQHLESLADKMTTGTIVEKKYEYAGKQNSTFAVEMADGKVIRLASSMERPEGFRGHMRTEHLVDEKALVGFPVGIKLHTLADGKKVIKIYNGKTGKFISWAKETNTGKKLAKELTDEQKDQLAHAETIIEPPITPPTSQTTISPIKPITDLDNQRIDLENKAKSLGYKDLNEYARKTTGLKTELRSQYDSWYKNHVDSLQENMAPTIEPEVIAEQTIKPIEKTAIENKDQVQVGDIIEDARGKKAEVTGFDGNQIIMKMEHDGNTRTANPKYEELFKHNSEQLQKQKSNKGSVEIERHEAVLKITKFIQSVLPKIKVIYDPHLEAAGKLSADGKTISINPYYANIDTPIHEAGHVIIDAMGYNNVTIQKAIKQLEKSKLWDETKSRYPELSDEMLAKEVLAEAIGREGAGIFEKESNISKFQKLLDKIYQWFKDTLGLERNEAKELAKKILRGEVSHLTGEATGEEQLQKPSDDLRAINEALKGTLTADEREMYENIKSQILDEIADSDEMAQIEDVISAKDLEGYTLDELIEVYNTANELGHYDTDITTKLKQRIAYYLNEHGKEVLRTNNKFIEDEANKKDLSWKDVNFKVLSHMSHLFPELQQLSPLFDEAYFNKINEASDMKLSLEKKAKAVIKEYNKKMGVGERLLGLISSDNAKYFQYLENNGELRKNTNGLSSAQIDLLNHMKDLLEKRNNQVNENDDLIQNEILKIDKTFLETYKTESLMSAISNYFGGSNMADVEIKYLNPITNKEETVSYLNAQKTILNHYKNKTKVLGINTSALVKLLKIAYLAKKGSGKSAYGLNYRGQLTNKFDKPRNKELGYSRDFYRAAQMFIDDYSHVKHMSKFVPIVNSLDYLYSQGYADILKKPNAKKWLDEWSQAQIFQTEKSTDPILDSSLKFLRSLTSMLVMAFNVPANVMNVWIGNYQSWRAESAALLLKGNKRLFGKDGLNLYGRDLIRKFHVVNLDIDSNPGYTAGKMFQRIAFAGQKYGEYQIQGSVFLGKLSDKEWDSFEYNKEGELVAKKGVDEKDLIKKFNKYKNEISDVQGKYSDKDRRNFARGELGKNAQQFKTFLPDFIKIRLGSEYIDGNGKTKRGSWRGYTDDAFSELKADIKRDGIKGFWNNKQAMENLKGLMFVTFLVAMVHGDDDDKNKRRKAFSAQNMLGNVLNIFSPEQLKYTLENSTASIGTLVKFIKVAQDIINMDSDKLEKDAKKVIPYNRLTDIPSQIEEIAGE